MKSGFPAPYASPKSEFYESSIVQKPNVGWKIFFWLLLTFKCLLIVAKIVNGHGTPLAISIEAVTYFFVLLGVFGYSYNKRTYYRYFWRIFIPFSLLIEVYSLVSLNWEYILTVQEVYIDNAIMLTIRLTLIVLQIAVLVKYSAPHLILWK